MLIRLNVKQH